MTLWLINMNNVVKKTVNSGLLLALALIFSYVEYLIPIPIPVPGIKLGLANSVLLYLIFCNRISEAFLIGVSRVLLSFLLFGNLYSLLFSSSGFLLAFLAMILVNRFTSCSLFGVSIAGAVFHNIGQILFGILFIHTVTLYYYIPILTIAGLITGYFIAYIVRLVVERIDII